MRLSFAEIRDYALALPKAPDAWQERTDISETKPQQITCTDCGFTFIAAPDHVSDRLCSDFCRAAAGVRREWASRVQPGWKAAA